MHAKSDLRVFLKWMIAGSGSVITDVIPLDSEGHFGENSMSEKLMLEQNFHGMDFLNSPRVAQSDQFLRIETDIVNANAIAIFICLLLLIATAIAYFFIGGREATLVLLSGAMAGGMFVGMFYLIAARDRDRVLPYFEKEQELLVLPNGTQIAKRDIQCFRQYACKTKISNFRLVLTTVSTKGANGTVEYAIAPVIGKLSEDCIGAALASCLGVKLIQDENRKFTDKEVVGLGLN